MATIMISKKMTKGAELVIIPLKEYERFKEIQTFLFREKEADDDIEAGRLSPPYRNKKDLKRALDFLKR